MRPPYVLDIECGNLYDAYMEILTPIIKTLGKLFMQPIFLILLLIGVSGGGIYLYTEYRNVSQELVELQTDPDAVNRRDAEELVKQIGRLTELPVGEEPTVATVSDVDSVKDQSFFRNAENGDRVLIYTEARRAILYRPSTDKIIEVGPVTIGDNVGLNSEDQIEGDGTETEESGASTGFRLAFSNATPTAGLTTTASDELTEKLPELDFEIVSRTDANASYDGTTVIVLGSGYAGAAQQIADILGGVVGELPEGEPTPDADVLVLLGNNYLKE